MVERRGRSGRFLSCAALGGCGATQPVPLDLPCPLGCGGEILERRSHRRRTFFGCSTFPACGFVAAGRPALEPCPDCGAPYLLESRSPRHGSVLACPHRACGYRRPSPTAVAEDAGGYGSRA
jgi:DNA topoisomerase-1